MENLSNLEWAWLSDYLSHLFDADTVAMPDVNTPEAMFCIAYIESLRLGKPCPTRIEVANQVNYSLSKNVVYKCLVKCIKSNKIKLSTRRKGFDGYIMLSQLYKMNPQLTQSECNELLGEIEDLGLARRVSGNTRRESKVFLKLEFNCNR